MDIRRHLKARWNEIFHRKELDVLLHEMNYKDGKIDAIIEFPGVALLASDIAGYFDAVGGKNWVEVTMLDRASMRQFVVTIQRKSGETPAQKIDRLEAEIQRLTGMPEG